MARDSAIRQGDITQAAFIALGRDEAIEFLNTANVTLGGRPIDIAIESLEGLDAVKKELARLGGAATA